LFVDLTNSSLLRAELDLYIVHNHALCRSNTKMAAFLVDKVKCDDSISTRKLMTEITEGLNGQKSIANDAFFGMSDNANVAVYLAHSVKLNKDYYSFRVML